MRQHVGAMKGAAYGVRCTCGDMRWASMGTGVKLSHPTVRGQSKDQVKSAYLPSCRLRDLGLVRLHLLERAVAGLVVRRDRPEYSQTGTSSDWLFQSALRYAIAFHK